MKGLTYFAALMALFAAMIFAQSSTQTPSDQSNSSPTSGQSQNPTNSGTSKHSHDANTGKMHDRQPNAGVPDTTVRDQQPSTTSTTGVSGQNNHQPSGSTMGTTGRTPGASEPTATTPPSDQQPNSSASPSSPQPQAYLMKTPAARAAATHTPDPGTCMNPAAVQTSDGGAQPHPGPPCD